MSLLRNLAVKMRIPAGSPAPRFLWTTRVLPESGSRPLPDMDKVAREWYMLQRGRYDDLNRDLRIISRVVLWTEKLERFLRRFYLIGAPVATGCVVLKWNDYQKADAAAMRKLEEDAGYHK